MTINTREEARCIMRQCEGLERYLSRVTATMTAMEEEYDDLMCALDAYFMNDGATQGAGLLRRQQPRNLRPGRELGRGFRLCRMAVPVTPPAHHHHTTERMRSTRQM